MTVHFRYCERCDRITQHKERISYRGSRIIWHRVCLVCDYDRKIGKELRGVPKSSVNRG